MIYLYTRTNKANPWLPSTPEHQRILWDSFCAKHLKRYKSFWWIFRGKKAITTLGDITGIYKPHGCPYQFILSSILLPSLQTAARRWSFFLQKKTLANYHIRPFVWVCNIRSGSANQDIKNRTNGNLGNTLDIPFMLLFYSRIFISRIAIDWHIYCVRWAKSLRLLSGGARLMLDLSSSIRAT